MSVDAIRQAGSMEVLGNQDAEFRFRMGLHSLVDEQMTGNRAYNVMYLHDPVNLAMHQAQILQVCIQYEGFTGNLSPIGRTQEAVAPWVERELAQRVREVVREAVTKGKVDKDLTDALRAPSFSPEVVKGQALELMANAINERTEPEKARTWAVLAGQYAADYEQSRKHPRAGIFHGYKESNIGSAIIAAKTRGSEEDLTAVRNLWVEGFGEDPDTFDAIEVVPPTKAELIEGIKSGASLSMDLAKSIGTKTWRGVKVTGRGVGVATKNGIASASHTLQEADKRKLFTRGGAGVVAAMIGAEMFFMPADSASAQERSSQGDISGDASTRQTEPLIVVAQPKTENDLASAASDTTVSELESGQRDQGLVIVAQPTTQETSVESGPDATAQNEKTTQDAVVIVAQPVAEQVATNSGTAVEKSPQDEVTALINEGNISGATQKIISLYGENSQQATANPRLSQELRKQLATLQHNIDNTTLDSSQRLKVNTLLAYFGAGVKRPAIFNQLPEDVINNDLILNLPAASLDALKAKQDQLMQQFTSAELGGFAGYDSNAQNLLTLSLAEMQVIVASDTELAAITSETTQSPDVAAQGQTNTQQPSTDSPAVTTPEGQGNITSPATTSPEVKTAPEAIFTPTVIEAPSIEVPASVTQDYDKQISDIISAADSDTVKRLTDSFAQVLEKWDGASLPVNANVMIAQALRASLDSPQIVSKQYHNIFGIQASADWTGQSAPVPYKDPDTGKTVVLDMRVYPDDESAIRDYVAILMNNFPDALANKGDDTAFLNSIANSDQAFITDMQSLITTYKLSDVTSLVYARQGAIGNYVAEQKRIADEQAAAEAERQRQQQEQQPSSEYVAPSEQELVSRAAQMMIDTGGEWTNRGIVLKYYTEHGFSVQQAAGFAGNYIAESGIQPDRNQNGGGPGRGIAQWEKGGRFEALLNFAAAQGKPWTDIYVQLDFTMWEFANTEQRALTKIQAAQSVEDATIAVSKYYERPGTPHNDKRVSFATDVQNQHNTLRAQVDADEAAKKQAAADEAAKKQAAEAAAAAVEAAAQKLAAGLNQDQGNKLLHQYETNYQTEEKTYGPIENHQCVSFVKWVLMHYSQKNPDDNSFLTMGNGMDVAANLADNGYEVNSTPAALAVVSFPAGLRVNDHYTTNADFGHTAVVLHVNDDGSIVIAGSGSPDYTGVSTISADVVQHLTFAHTEQDLSGILSDPTVSS